MREAAKHEYARLLKQEFVMTLKTGVYQTDESEEEEEDSENSRNEEHGRSALSKLASPCSTIRCQTWQEQTETGIASGGDVDAMQELDKAPTKQADDDELSFDSDLVVHEELVAKGVGSVKSRTAHLHGLLLR
ncbi:hypothetical protein EDB85DRAFT_1887651 [Lactarius pseudohatsudake]|nr:hypothetical protein EDB85DRAFT_1887651 [Lactarius pseudohatsudake]